MTALARTVRKQLEALADDATRRKYERLVPGAKVLGVAVPALRQLAAQLKKDHRDLTLEDACGLLTRFAAAPIREEMLVGIFVVGRFGKRIKTVPWSTVEKWAAALDNWETCDQLASNVAAEVVAADAQLVFRLVRLARAKNPWARRFAIATSADLTHAGFGSTDAAFKVCSVVLEDDDGMVQTAIGWAIREASKADEAAAFRFLSGVKSRMRPRTLRDAAAKLSPAHRDVLRRWSETVTAREKA